MHHRTRQRQMYSGASCGISLVCALTGCCICVTHLISCCMCVTHLIAVCGFEGVSADGYSPAEAATTVHDSGVITAALSPVFSGSRSLPMYIMRFNSSSGALLSTRALPVMFSNSSQHIVNGGSNDANNAGLLPSHSGELGHFIQMFLAA